MIKKFVEQWDKCDTMQRIQYEARDDKQERIKLYMTLALHMVQATKTFEPE